MQKTVEGHDIRELARRLAEAEATIELLKQGRQRLRDIIDGLGPSMFVGLLTPAGIVLEANRSALEAAGIQSDDVLGRAFEDTPWWSFSEDSKHRLRQTIERAANGEASRYDVEVCGEDGQFIEVDFSLQPLRNDSGAIAFLVPSATIITERKLAENALRQSDANFQQLANNISDVFWIRSPDMREVHYVSPAFERVWGVPAAQLYADPAGWTEFIVLEDRARVVAAFARLTGGPTTVDEEYRILRADGQMRWVRSRGFQVRDSSGALIRLIGIVTDVTESRITAEALRTSLEEFRALAESMPQIVWITRPDGWNLYLNQQWTAYTGLTAAAGLGYEWNRQFHPDEQAEALLAWKHATDTGTPYTFESRLRRADGVYRWSLVRGVPMRDASGVILKWIGTCTDIDDLKLALLENARTNRALKMLSSCGEALLRADGEQALLEAICRISVEVGGYRMAWVGYAENDAVRSVVPMAHAGAETGYLSAISLSWDAANPFGQGPAGQVIRTGQAAVRDDLASAPDVEPLRALGLSRGYVGVICLPLRNGDETFGILVLYAGEVRETSGEELALLQEVADDLALGITNLRVQAERQRLRTAVMVSDRMASIGTLAAGVAHEINNPLTAVIGNLDYIADRLGRTMMGESSSGSRVLNETWLREEVGEPLDEAREAAHRVRFIVRDLKVFSRSPGEEPSGSTDVKAVMESSLRMAWNEIRHRAQLVKHYEAVPGVLANEARLGQVFLNLVVNAAQAIPEGQADRNEIRVTTRLEAGRVVVEVSDTGPGIPPDIINRVFDAFFTTKPIGVGTGLGLAICHRLITDMQGALTVTSVVGQGTVFRVELPPAEEQDFQALAAPFPASAVVTGRRGRILVVDDEELVLKIVKRVLSPEHQVTALGSARDALALVVGGERFDLILCDLMMPDMTGMDLHRELSRIAPDLASRMIFVTGGAFTDKARSFLSDSPKEQIEKPFNPANLRAVAQRYMR